MTRVTVLGLGNVLNGDDALGPHVIRKLQAFYEFDEGVSLLDVRAPGSNLHALAPDADVVIVVDIIPGAGQPGELRTFRGGELRENVNLKGGSAHRPGLREALLQLEEAGAVELCVVGVTPERVQTGVGMSAAVSAAVTRALEAVIRELTRLGHAPRRTWSTSRPQAWWEQAATT